MYMYVKTLSRVLHLQNESYSFVQETNRTVQETNVLFTKRTIPSKKRNDNLCKTCPQNDQITVPYRAISNNNSFSFHKKKPSYNNNNNKKNTKKQKKQKKNYKKQKNKNKRKTNNQTGYGYIRIKLEGSLGNN